MPEEPNEHEEQDGSNEPTDAEHATLAQIESTPLESQLVESVDESETKTEPESNPEAVTTPTAEPAKTDQSRPWLKEELPKKKSKKLLVVIVAALLVVFGSAWSAYALWYQNPDKVVADALSGLMQAKTVSITGKSTSSGKVNSTVTTDISAGYEAGIEGTVSMKPSAGSEINVSAISDTNRKLYVKVNNLMDILNSGDKTAGAFLAPLAGNLDDKWIELSPTVMGIVNSDLSAQYNCNRKIMTKLSVDSSELSEVANLYMQNNFFKVKKSLGTVDGNIGFVVAIDAAKAQAFVTAFETTKLYSDVKKCSPGITTLFDNIDWKSLPSSTAELWISQWAHQLKQVKSESDSHGTTMTGDVSITQDAPITVEAPKDSTTLEKLFGGGFLNGLLPMLSGGQKTTGQSHLSI